MAQSTWRIGTFRDQDAADKAVGQLREMGYDNNEISVMMADKEQARELARVTGATAVDGAAAGAGIGGGLGAIIAGLAATGTIAATGGAATPLVAGPLAAALAGLGAGGVAGGIVGALIGVGVPKAQALAHERELNEGAILVGVQHDQEDPGWLADVLPEETDSGQQTAARPAQTSAQGTTTIGNGGSTPRRDADVGDEDPQTGERRTFGSDSIGGHLSNDQRD